MLTPDALEFLAQAVEQQASLEKVTLAPAERQMLRWSEVEPGAFNDPAASVEFERNYNSSEYEARVTDLLRRARERITTSHYNQAWSDAVEALKGHDYYLLVMLRQSDGGSANNKAAGRSSLRDNLIYLAVGLGIAVAFFLYILTRVH